MSDNKALRPLLGVPDAVLATFIRQWRREGREWEMVVEGDCMEPALHAGERLLIRARCEPVKVGDVIVVRQRGRLCAHRVVKIDREWNGPVFTTRGDRNDDVDRPRTALHMVLGGVTGVIGPRGPRPVPPDGKGGAQP